MGELISLIEETAAENPGMPAISSELALAHAEGNRADGARRLLEQFAATDFDLPQDMLWIIGMVHYAEAAVACRARDYAAALLDRLAPWADQLSFDDIISEGPVSHYVGELVAVLGRYDDADAYFSRAAAFNERANAKFFGARTNLSWGKMLAERNAPGDAEMARDVLTKAQISAASEGYANVERRATEALQPLARRD